VPPYSADDETMLSPADASMNVARSSDAIPEDVATAPTPFSSEAIRSSRAAFVGFMIRE